MGERRGGRIGEKGRVKEQRMDGEGIQIKERKERQKRQNKMDLAN